MSAAASCRWLSRVVDPARQRDALLEPEPRHLATEPLDRTVAGQHRRPGQGPQPRLGQGPQQLRHPLAVAEAAEKQQPHRLPGGGRDVRQRRRRHGVPQHLDLVARQAELADDELAPVAAKDDDAAAARSVARSRRCAGRGRPAAPFDELGAVAVQDDRDAEQAAEPDHQPLAPEAAALGDVEMQQVDAAAGRGHGQAQQGHGEPYRHQRLAVGAVAVDDVEADSPSRCRCQPAAGSRRRGRCRRGRRRRPA